MRNFNYIKSDLLKTQKGITLVALIITIIVLLITVVVSVKIKSDFELVETTHETTMEAERQTIYEQILASRKVTDRGRIDINSTYEVAKNVLEKQGNNVSAIENGIFRVEGKKGTYSYTITEKEILMD